MKLTTVKAMGEEWQTEHADLLELAIKAPIPPREALLMQLRRDGASWEMWILVLIALGALGSGLALLNAGLLFWGGGLTAILSYVFFQVGRGHTRATLLRGVISDPGQLRRHPMWVGYQATATLTTGDSTREARIFVGRKEPVDLLKRTGRVEVLVHFNSKSEYSTMLAWRAPA